MHFLAQRIASMETSIFSVITQKAQEYQAVNLGQGFPDFNGPDWIFQEAFDAMRKGHNQYAPTIGVETLRKTIAANYQSIYGLSYDYLSEVTVTSGATEAIFDAILGLIDPGDEVIVFEPYYDSYKACIEIAGGIPVYITLHYPSFSFDPEDLNRAITPKTKAIILNSPHNPSGKVFGREELEIIRQCVLENDIIVISDEVYEFMTYPPHTHIPMASLPDMRDKTLTISSTAKTFGLTGWKIGYTCASPTLTQAVRRMHQFVTFATATPFQYGMALAMSRLDAYLPEMRQMYQQKKDRLYLGLQTLGFDPVEPQGTYFIVTAFKKWSTLPDFDFCIHLMEKAGVATIPLSVFYQRSEEGKSLIRFCFAKRDETLNQALDQLSNRLPS